MLKKVITRAAATVGVVATAAIVSTVSTTGVAYAHGGENNPDCSSHEKTTQVNKGTQVLGNIVAKHLNGGIAGSIEKPGLCPSILNNNKVFSR